MARKSPKKYTDEFREEAIKLVTESGYTQAQAAESLGMTSKNLNRWLNKSKGVKKEAPNEIQKENAALRKELQQLKLEREILKKAAAFFAKELD